jgi:hypothetical protein
MSSHFNLKGKWGLIVLFGFIFFNSCKKFVEVDAPYTSFNSENVYTTDATAIAAITTMFTRLGTANGGITATTATVTCPTALSADELVLFPGNAPEATAFYKNDLTSSTAPTFWLFYYQEIYLANAAIEGLNKSTTLTPAVKQQLLGEAKFIRAFCFFYLANLYGDVPLAISTNYKVNSLMSRTPEVQVWQQIKTDLLEAGDLLNENYVGADLTTGNAVTERVRPNKWAAAALLSRAYLYSQEWENAEFESTAIINVKNMYDTVPLSKAFLKDPTINKEAIWQIQSVTTGWNTNDGRLFILPTAGPNTSSNPVSLNREIIYSFEANDGRRSNWTKGIKVGSDSFYYAYKYKSATLNASVTEYLTVFRLSEQYLIRAEARAQLDKISEAQSDLNTIRKKAGLENIMPATKADLINAILEERRHELFCEWGHRWLDLKRTNKVDQVMGKETPLKGGVWQPTDKFYPISIDELTANPNLTQTPGY